MTNRFKAARQNTDFTHTDVNSDVKENVVQVQKEMINDKVEWQQKKDEMLLEIENKKKALNDAINAQRSLVNNLTNSKAVKDATIQNYVVELEKRYITQ